MRFLHNGVWKEYIPKPKIGDLVASVATPIARLLHLPCIDPKTKDLRPESGCAKRKQKLNKLI
jgi:hypothetical protein